MGTYNYLPFISLTLGTTIAIYTVTMSTANTNGKKGQRRDALEHASIADFSRLSCKQRKKLRSVVHARNKRLGHSTDWKFDSRRVQVNGIQNLDRTCQNDGEVTFKDRYARHTLYSSATKQTINPASRAGTQVENNDTFSRRNISNGSCTKQHTKQLPASNKVLARVAGGKNYSVG